MAIKIHAFNHTAITYGYLVYRDAQDKLANPFVNASQRKG